MSGTDKAPYARKLESLWAKVHAIYMLQYDADMLDDDLEPNESIESINAELNESYGIGKYESMDELKKDIATVRALLDKFEPE